MRVQNWRDEMQKVIDAADGRPFRWGRHDCCQFVAKCIAAVTGNDYRAIFPRYVSRAEAEQLLTDHGGMRGLLTEAFGPPVEAWKASVGDIVLIDMGLGPQPAVCRGIKSVAPGRRGLQEWPTARAVAAWVF